MRQAFTFILLFLFFCSEAQAQPNYTADSIVPAYTGSFGVGVNMGFYANWSNINQAVIAAGDPSLGIKGVGANTIRPGMYADVYANFGYNISQVDFAKYHQLGMKDFTGIIGGTPEWQRDYTTYCEGTPSTLFKDMYLPIWDNSDGTPINEANHYAYYMYRMVNMYKDDVTFWEIWNEPGFDYTNGNGRKQPGEPGNWWDNDPDPCDYKLRAPIQHYVRMLRISWEVIKTLDPQSYVTLGDPGFPSFLDAILRNSDNPDAGIVTPDFPKKGGAYFDCMTYHSYPHFDYSAYDPAINLFKRHSDGGADGLIVARDRFQAVLNTYGYNGTVHPKKLWNVTEYNAPRVALTGPWVNGEDLQINYLLKVLMKAKVAEIAQMHIYNLFDVRSSIDAIDEFDLMGLYATNTGVLPYQQVVNPQGKTMRTFSLLLEGSSYDTLATQALNLPDSVGGYAFRTANDSLVYALWAKTATDLSETATATYHFPVGLGLDSLSRFAWDYGYTNQKSTVSDSGLVLTGRPIFLTRKSTNTCQTTTLVSNITCSDNGTNTISTDDKWSFSLLVQSANTSATLGWKMKIGTTNYTGQYGVAKLIANRDISAGNINVLIKDVADTTCTKQLLVTAPGSCSVPPATNYCASQSEFPWHDWIAGFAVGAIQNPSGKAPYTDYTNISTALTPGTTYTATLTPGYSWIGFQENWRVWIDFNKNKVFEANELVLEHVQPSNSAVNTSIQVPLVIPAGAATGTTRMRVSMRRGTFAGPCELLSFGEVEDYAVNISGTTGACALSVNISAITCNDNGTPTIGSDDVFTCKALVTGSNASTGWVATSGSSTVSGTYGVERILGPFSILSDVQILFKDQLNNACVTNTTVTKPNPCSLGGGNGTYCTSVSDFPWHDWIAQIKVADLDFVTGKSTYSHYPGQTATVTRGANHVIQLTGAYSWMIEDEFWRIWIDYNRDGVFSDTEIAFSQFNPKSPFPGSLWSVNGSINIPTTAPTGITRMRIVMKRGNTPPSSCGTYANGETEDYSVNIVTGGVVGTSCTISAVVSSKACQSKGTPSVLDDTYSFDLLVTGAGTKSPLGWKAIFGSDTITGAYGQVKSVANRLISAGALSILVRDADSISCAQTILVTPPPTCSNNTGPCTAVSAFPWHHWIAGVALAQVDQASSKSNFSDFTSQVASVVKDSTYNIELKGGFSWKGYNTYWRVWVDGNNNGEWESKELLVDTNYIAAPYDVYAETYNAPIRFDSIPNGQHKMRIIMRRDTAPDPCGIIDFGEVEDYTVQVGAALLSSKGTATKTVIDYNGNWAVYPNPAVQMFVLASEFPLDADARVTLIDQLGRVQINESMAVKSQYLEMNALGLAPGLYMIKIDVSGKRTVLRKVIVVAD
jgi:GEVED domain/Secretion system C-terminal sorting domain